MEELVNIIIIIGCSSFGILTGCIVNYFRTRNAKRNNSSTTTNDSKLEEQLGRVTDLYEKATKLLQEKLDSQGSTSDSDK